MDRIICFFLFFTFTILMVAGSALGRHVVVWMVDFPGSCFYLWILILELRGTEGQPQEVPSKDDSLEEDRDSLVEFYREGL